eukprot:GFUD01066085.1.p1 GENE.GFUD01066085.1~~GFUD01066085.1.p1  ORF type:complete len:105 (+),score=22.48 GFUD01066085.1:39-317(+)
MAVSVIVSSLFLILVLTTSTCSPLPMAVDKCRPSMLPRLPTRMKNICLSLLNTIEQFEDQLESAQSSQVVEFYQPEDKRRDADHVFLRFGRS